MTNPSSQATFRIFLLEDNRTENMLLRLALSSLRNSEVVPFAQPSTLLAQLQEEHPDLLVTDLMLPEMDGMQVIEKLRQQLPELPVMIVSSDQSPERKAHAKQLGVKGFFTKTHFCLEQLKKEILDMRSSGASSQQARVKA